MMPDEQYPEPASGPSLQSHPARWLDPRNPAPTVVPQHDGCEAIGSVLNGSYKTRWHTRRAGAIMVLGSLTGFSASMAIGAVSLLAAVVALGFGTATVMVYRVERKQRLLRGLRPW